MDRLQDFESDLYFLLGQRDEADPTTTSGKRLLDKSINASYFHVAEPKTFDHPEISTTVDFTIGSGTPVSPNLESQVLPANIVAIQFVRNETTQAIYDPEHAQELLDRIGGSDRRFARRDNLIYLRTTPPLIGQTVRVYYWLFPAALVNPNDVTILRGRWDQVILELSGAYAWSRLGVPAQADFYDERAARMMNDVSYWKDLESQQKGWRNDLYPQVPLMRGYK